MADLEERVEELERLVDFMGRTLLVLAQPIVASDVRADIVADLADEFGPRPDDPY